MRGAISATGHRCTSRWSTCTNKSPSSMAPERAAVLRGTKPFTTSPPVPSDANTIPTPHLAVPLAVNSAQLLAVVPSPHFASRNNRETQTTYCPVPFLAKHQQLLTPANTMQLLRCSRPTAVQKGVQDVSDNPIPARRRTKYRVGKRRLPNYCFRQLATSTRWRVADPAVFATRWQSV
eukprot:CAMPEP_0181333336 /NCGR_PEP_ID=MMETSP1101-20121128/25617_1 /TAXON_ID=46948 /ORGANISM="Rhodomonas abbreviata, Strain Caron Lab Isolate" /LENGTH=177 /DNA_ID=CAMNT_0023443129 /DNA_START=20 /DNA_END=551 /DNA_ORIENTATION=-